METWNSKSMSSRYLTNNEIDKTKKEILAERLKRINESISQINFKRSIYSDDFMSMKYNKLISQKKKIESILNYSEK